MKSVILLSFVVILLSYVQAQFLILPVVSEETNSNGPYECTCEFIYDDYDPICGTDGSTYSNPSLLYCTQKCKNPNLSILHKGSCKYDSAESKNSTKLGQQLDPLEPKILNKCQSNCPKSTEYNPICGTNGITYENILEFQCDKKCRQSKLFIARYGLCREEEYFKDINLPFLTRAVKKCGCSLSHESDPVCGTDGYTYPNPSAVRCVTSCTNPSLRIVHFGPCIEQQKPHNIGATRCDCISTTQYYRPICADNGVTYDNYALLYCAQRCLDQNLKETFEYPCRNDEILDERKF